MKPDKKQGWEEALKGVLLLKGDEPIEVIFSGGVSRTSRVIPWSMFVVAMNKLLRDERGGVIDEVKEWVKTNQKGQFEDDSGVVCWYLKDLVKSLDYLKGDR